jgi:transcriptional regulator with XRE-family HTH domain
MSTAITLAANLRAVMVERGLSPEELARGCSLELARVQAALFGEGVSTLAEIDRLTGWLTMSPEDLLTEHDAMR